MHGGGIRMSQSRESGREVNPRYMRNVRRDRSSKIADVYTIREAFGQVEAFRELYKLSMVNNCGFWRSSWRAGNSTGGMHAEAYHCHNHHLCMKAWLLSLSPVSMVNIPACDEWLEARTVLSSVARASVLVLPCSIIYPLFVY